MMKKLLLVIFVLGASITFAQKGKLAHVDAITIMQELAVKDSVEMKMQQQMAMLRTDLQREENNFNKELMDFQSKMDSLAPMMRKMREENLQKKQAELQKRPQEYEMIMQQYQLDLMGPIEKKLKEAIAKIAKEKGYAYVLEKSQIMYSDGGIDISDLVRKELGLPNQTESANPAGK